MCNLVDMLGTFRNSLAYLERCNFPIECVLRMHRITSDVVSILQMAKKTTLRMKFTQILEADPKTRSQDYNSDNADSSVAMSLS